MKPPIENCLNFVKSRPPSVLFFLCFFIVTITLFTFTVHIKNSDKLINNDVIQNWKSLKKHLNHQNLCAVNTTNNLTGVYNYSFIALAELKFTHLGNFKGSVEAYYDVEGWQPLCPKMQQKYLKIEFAIPENGTDKICAKIQGPEAYLPEMGSSCDFTAKKTALFISGGNRCENELNLVFGDDDTNDIFLKEIDRKLIYFRLVCTSLVLLFALVIVVIFVMFYQNR